MAGVTKTRRAKSLEAAELREGTLQPVAAQNEHMVADAKHLIRARRSAEQVFAIAAGRGVYLGKASCDQCVRGSETIQKNQILRERREGRGSILG